MSGVGQILHLQQCRSHLLDLITVSSNRRFPSSGCRGGSLRPKTQAIEGSTPRDKLQPFCCSATRVRTAGRGGRERSFEDLAPGRRQSRQENYLTLSELASGGDHLQRRKLHQRSDGEGPGHAPELGLPLVAFRELHAR